MRDKHLLLKCIFYLLICFPKVKSVEIKCEQNSEGKYVCVEPEVLPYLNHCCRNHDLDYYYCCPHLQYRNESYINRISGLVVAAVILIILICVLCVFCDRCPIRWIYLKKRAQQQGDSELNTGPVENSRE